MRSPCHIRMYKTNINIFHKQILIKSCKNITMTILLVNMWHKLQLASVCKLYCLLPALPEVRSLWPTPRYSWPQQACPRDGGRPGDAQVQSAIAEKHVYCVKNLTCFALFDFDLIFNIYVLTSANQFWFEKTTFGLPASGSGSQMSSESYSSSFGLCVSVFLFFCLFACLS